MAKSERLILHEGQRHDQACATTWAVTVADSVLADAIINESSFKAAFRSILDGLVQKAADRFFEEHQEWVADVFNVQQLRISLYEHLQQRIIHEMEKTGVA